jgi:hypothetical protein
VRTGTLDGGALEGYVGAARGLGEQIDDPASFVADHQAKVFAWAKDAPDIRNGTRGCCFDVVDLVNRPETETRSGKQGRTADYLNPPRLHHPRRDTCHSPRPAASFYST